ncbi:MAG: hypothetical protein JJE51_14360 [Thermoanaerobaculia bacterium]|nr:hypothetical protein [Thermoanaerobaculia bacterium]
MRTAYVFLLICLSAFPLGAQYTQPPYERILLPLAPGEVTGGLGSRWLVELVGRNRADVTLDISDKPASGCAGTCGIQPRFTFGSPVYRENPNTGTFIYVGAPGRDKVSFSLRVRELSRSAETWGVAIPVVRERDFSGGLMSLIDVPTTAGFRTSLRVYDFQGVSGAEVRMRIYNLEDYDPLIDDIITLTHAPDGRPDTPSTPASFMIADLVAAFPQLASLKRGVRIELLPVTAGTTIWAYASITHNETQWVTLVLPD